MLPTPAITSGIQTWWRDHLPLDVPTIYPGTHLNTAALPAWYELGIDVWSRPPRRITNTDALHIAVTLHIFVKATTNRARLHQLADTATTTLQHQSIALHDPTTSDTPLVGYAALHEAQLRDLTRPQQPHSGDNLQHLVLTIEGRAEAVASG